LKTAYRCAIVACAAALSTALILPRLGFGQDADEKAKAAARAKANKAKAIAQNFEAAAGVLTLYDRQGKALGTFSERAIYLQPVFSPDAKRVAVAKVELEKEAQDLWVMDVATGNGTQLTFHQSRESAGSPAWSPDGSQVAYVAQRAGTFGLYRRAANGSGTEELVYKHNAPMTLTGWSMDGRYLNFFSTDLSGGVLYALPLNESGEKKPVEVFRSQSQIQGGRPSPDNRFVTYVSNESGRNEIYVRPWQSPAGGGPWKISEQGSPGMAMWRRDGKEFYFASMDRAIMAVEISTAGGFEFGKPRVLFRMPEGAPLNPRIANISRDGERIIVASPPSQLRQITVLDRQGKIAGKVGEPGVFGQLAISHDGTRVAVTRNDPRTGSQDLWTYEISSGKGTQITSDTYPQNSPVWSADDSQLAYVSTHDNGKYFGIYRKASNGTGDEELLFQYTPGAGISLSDWSPDGKFLTFYTGVMLMVPLDQGKAGGLDRKAHEWLRDENTVGEGRFSPDSRWIAYGSDEIGENLFGVFVRRFDSNKLDAPGPGPVVEITNKQGTNGMINWRNDGKEIYYIDPANTVMSVEVSTVPELRASPPKALFKAPTPVNGLPGLRNVSGDGQRFVFLAPVAPGALTR
jgi:Tol biopolymer transport system component